MPRRTDIESIALIGSGPIVIGQAAEFDYAGCQALKVLREDGYRTIVINSNPATIMTDPGFADRTYLSPGPGDPAPLAGETRMLQDLLGRVPVLGVCLGHQLLAMATGKETFKLPFGHRGANHPVIDHRSRKVLVTSQNHGFAVASGDESGVTHSSLYDGTVEGLDYPELRARSAQFHPEASPGPHDAASIIGSFVDELKAA